MLITTHALTPVILKQAVDLRSAPERYTYRQLLIQWLIIAVFGVLPDLLTPHISLGARFTSFSHAWKFTAAVAVSGMSGTVLAALFRRKWKWMPLWCASAYLLHVFGDIISGGLNFIGTGEITGDYYISPEYWPLCEVVVMGAFVYLHRMIRRRHGLNPSVLQVLKTWYEKRCQLKEENNARL